MAIKMSKAFSQGCASFSEIILCLTLAGILLGWGGGGNYAVQTQNSAVFAAPIQYGWLSTSSNINSSVTTTVRNIQPQAIGPYSEENYGAYEVWYTIIPGSLFGILALVKLMFTGIEMKTPAYSDTTVVSQALADQLSDDVGLDELAEFTKGLDISGRQMEDAKPKKNSRIGLIGWGSLFFPMYIGTGLFLYIFGGSWWSAMMMYHFGHVFISQKYFFVVGFGMMGLSLISVEVATALVVTGKTRNATVAGLTWAIWFVSLGAYVFAASTVGNVITNQENAWENPLSGADAAYTSLTVYTLATPTRDLTATTTLYYYDILQWMRVVVYFYFVVQGVRLLRSLVMLFADLIRGGPVKKSGGTTKMTWSDWQWWGDLALWLAWMITEVAMYAEPILLAIAFCHTDGDVIYIQRHMIPGRVKM